MAASQKKSETQSAEHEYEDSPDAPFNQKAERPLGSKENQHPETPDEEIEKQKQYFYGGTKP